MADYLTKKGEPFRSAYKTTGQIVAYCIANNKVLEEMTLAEYKEFDSQFEDDVFEAIDLKRCVESRISAGGTNQASADEQIKYIQAYVK